MAESAFIGYLIEIGLKKYEKSILPLENGDEPPENLDRVNSTLSKVLDDF
jgi:hypothetical protein